MAKARTLVDAVVDGIEATTRRRTWWDDLDDKAQAQLLDVRQRFQSGEFGTRGKALTVAKSLVPSCEERGWKVCDIKRMSEWLRQKS